MPKRPTAPRAVMLVVAALLITGAPGRAALAGPPDQADAVQVFSRDVLILSGASLVNPDSDTDPDEQLITSSGWFLNTGPDDPITWGEWSAATATSRAARIGGPRGPRTDVRLSLSNLVPGGVYSVFWATIEPDSEQPLCPGVERTLPLDAFKVDADAPDANSFVADTTGAAEFHGRVDGDLLAARQVFFSVVYHAFGETHYPFPNAGESQTQGEGCRSSFGIDAMRHLLILQKW